MMFQYQSLNTLFKLIIILKYNVYDYYLCTMVISYIILYPIFTSTKIACRCVYVLIRQTDIWFNPKFKGYIIQVNF